MAQNLARHGETEEIEAVLTHLENAGLLSDARYAEGFVRARAPRFGAVRLRYELRKKGIAEELIDVAISGQSDGDAVGEFERARAIWQRKFGSAPAGARDYARQARFLQNLGFRADIVRRVLGATDE
jgi:regulatory protein